MTVELFYLALAEILHCLRLMLLYISTTSKNCYIYISKWKGNIPSSGICGHGCNCSSVPAKLLQASARLEIIQLHHIIWNKVYDMYNVLFDFRLQVNKVEYLFLNNWCSDFVLKLKLMFSLKIIILPKRNKHECCL